MLTFSEFLLRFKIPWILILIAATAVGVYFSLRVRMEVQAESLLRTDDPSIQNLKRYDAVFPSAESRFLVGVDLNPAYHRGGEALLETLARELRALPGIDYVTTPRDAVGGGDPGRSKSVRDLLLARDLATGALVVFLKAEANNTSGRDRVFTAVHGVLDRHLPRDRYAIVGTPFYRREFVRFIGEDQVIFIPVTLVMLLILLACLFRRWLWVGLPFVTVIMTVVWTGGLLGMLQRPLTMLTGALPTLLISIGVAVAIHVIFRYREERFRGGDARAVARRTVAQVGLPCLLTTITTMVGFGSLILARIPDIREFGILASVGVGFSFLICMVLIPYALAAGFRRDRRPCPDGPDRLGRALAASCHLASTRPVAIIIVCVAFLVVAAFGVAKVDMDAYLTDDMGETTFIYHSYGFFEKRLASLIPLDVVVESERAGGLLTEEGQRALAGLQAFCEKQPFVMKTLSALDVLADYRVYRPLQASLVKLGGRAGMRVALRRLNREAPVGALTDAEGTIGRVVCLLRDIGARRSFRFYDDIQDFAARELPPGYRVSVAGVSVLANRVVTSITREGGRSFLLAFLVIFVVVCFLFRSVRTGFLCLVGTLIPIFVGAGAMGVLGIVIRTSTVIVGSIALGLAIDLTIHLLGRYRRERGAGRTLDEALHRAMVHTGKPIVVSGGILVLGFGTLGFSRFGLTSEFGILAAITIATALVTTLFMLPALLKLGVLEGGLRRKYAGSPPPRVG